MAAPNADQINRVRALLSTSADSDADSGANAGWNEAWKESVTPWDNGAPQPALLSILESAELGGRYLPKSGQALVAGCGRGYDTLALAEFGLDHALGIDISEEAVRRAGEWLASQPKTPARSKVTFQVQDFFRLESALADLAYDYTFFCAIPPAWRPRWAETYARVIKPGGVLVAMVYPIKGPDAGPEGPPFNVAPEHYKALLSADFDLLWEGVPPRQRETHVGKELAQIWKRK